MNIWQIQQDLLAVFDELEENGGELTEELEERLAIGQENFKSKVEGYVNVIKQIKSDIAAIDQESKRLADLKKSKNAVIERLTKVLCPAIERFGDVSKSGSAFVDYGTGKVTIRNTQKVELDDDKVDAITNEFSKAIAYEAMLGNASNREGFTYEEMIQRCKEHTEVDPIDGGTENASQEVTVNDIMATEVEVSFKKPLCELMSAEDGYKIVKEIASTGNFVIKPSITKSILKSSIIAGSDITIGKIIDNQSLTIK